MSRTFDGTNTFHLDAASTPVSAPPITICAWVKPAVLGTALQIFNVGTTGSNNNRMAISLVAANGGRFSDVDGTTSHDVISSNIVPDTTSWHVVIGCAVDHTATGRVGDLDGYIPGEGTNIGGTSTATAANSMRICGSQGGANNFNGLIAHVALWNIVLSAADRYMLSRVPPNLIQPASLVEYWPLMGNQSPEPSFGTTGTSMTLTGAVVFSTDGPSFDPKVGRIGSYIGVMP